MDSMLHVESLRKETVTEIRKTIVEILNQDKEEKTIRFALKTLSEITTNLPPVYISGCIFKGKKARKSK
jgi:N-glycosylase/DNA lyase